MRHGVGGRSLVLASLVGALAVLAAGWVVSAQEARLDGATLRVATWGGSWRDAIHETIGKELERRGAKVEYVIGNPRDSLNKLIAARGREVPFDVMELDDGTKPQLLEGQFLEELNYASLPNSRDLDPNQRDRYTVSTLAAQDGIVYNVKKFEELGIPKPERFKDLFHPKLAGRVSFPDINHGMAINGIVGFAAEAGGDETNIDPGLELIKKLPVAAFYKSSVELSTKFNSGDVLAAPWHVGWALRVRRAGVPVGMSYPRVKDKRGMLEMVWAGIPKGTKARRAAEFFINRYLDPEVQVELPKKTGIAPVSKAALAKLAADPELKGLMLLEPAKIRNLYYIDWSKVNVGEWVSKWNRVMAR
jgi:putative spermidine/putrescine transport system substrate-binding protein